MRGPEALDLLKAWGTGHPGGVASIHGDSVRGGLFHVRAVHCGAPWRGPAASRQGDRERGSDSPYPAERGGRTMHHHRPGRRDVPSP